VGRSERLERKSYVQRFAYDRGWMGSNAMWTKERPFDVGLDGIPHFALLDIEGGVETAAEDKLRRIEWMIANGRANSAVDAASDLAKSVAGMEGIAEQFAGTKAAERATHLMGLAAAAG
jgi:hypothetical protein